MNLDLKKPVSPCIGVCRLDATKVCIGCKRTVDEITRWTQMTAEQQLKVLEALKSRPM